MLAEPGVVPGGAWAVLYSERGWPLLFAGVTAIAWLFPDGGLPSPRWRPFALAGAVSFAAFTVLSFLSSEPYSSEVAHLASPLPRLSGAAIGLTVAITGLCALATLAGGALAMVTRFRRSYGVERLQLKWLAYAALSIPATVVVCLLEIAIAGEEGAATLIALVVTMIAVPAAIAVAVLRYRLYEIDRLINLTLVYLVLTVALGAAFAAVAILGGIALGRGSTAPTAAATLAVAVAFRPLRSRVQALVDRRLNPEGYEGLRRVDRFLTEVREGRAEPEAMGAVLAAAVSDPTLQLFFWLPRDSAHADARGRLLPSLPPEPGGRTPVRRGELPLGTVVHDPKLVNRPDLLEAAINRAGLAIEIARLRVEVRHQLAEVEESRARIVAAATTSGAGSSGISTMEHSSA